MFPHRSVHLQFMLKSPIKVMRADLLEKEEGVSELYRNTYVKAIMRGDGSFLVVWAGVFATNRSSFVGIPIYHRAKHFLWSEFEEDNSPCCNTVTDIVVVRRL